jgi:hypothetical protein
MTSMLAPVLALIVLTLLMWIWMYATRIATMQKAGIKLQEARHPGSLNGLPSLARHATDNYNHLLEQPTIFYVLVFYIVFSGHSDGLHIYLAWAYVALRVVHSLIRCTANVVVTAGFFIFSLSTLVLMVMAARELLALL